MPPSLRLIHVQTVIQTDKETAAGSDCLTCAPMLCCCCCCCCCCYGYHDHQHAVAAAAISSHLAPCARSNAIVFALASSETLSPIPATDSGVRPSWSRCRHGVRLPRLLRLQKKKCIQDIARERYMRACRLVLLLLLCKICGHIVYYSYFG